MGVLVNLRTVVKVSGGSVERWNGTAHGGVPACRRMLVLAAVHDSLSAASSATSVIVMLLALGLSVIAYRAARLRSTPSLKWVGVAFVVFALKNGFSAFNVWTHTVPHDAIELALSIFDLVLLALLFAPLVLRRRG